MPHSRLAGVLLGLVLTVAPAAAQHEAWWEGLGDTERAGLAAFFDAAWFDALAPGARADYARVAFLLEGFATSGADSNEHDNYVGFAPLLFRASFHSSATYDIATGSAGSDGGTLFHPAELDDAQNACIEPATTALADIQAEVPRVSKADAAVIGGVVALHVLGYPRLDLLRITGGRRDLEHVAYRDRLPSADDDPEPRFTAQLGFSTMELVALIGGGHEVGSAHGLCSGYIGSWTPTPLQWMPPTFFADLFRDEYWKWYEICTYKNETAYYLSIDDPFADGLPAEEHDEEPGDPDALACPIAKSKAAFICEEQAIAGDCTFEDGLYDVGATPCADGRDLVFRLKSDFFLRANPALAPHAATFRDDPDLYVETFGVAYHKLTHLGLERCGMMGHGCPDGSSCFSTLAPDGLHVLYEDCHPDAPGTQEPGGSGDRDDNDQHSREWYNLSTSASIVAITLLLVCGVVALGLAAACCLMGGAGGARGPDKAPASADEHKDEKDGAP
eukprot:CAMPEP_0185689408 /NCGR_PEP_ID=MMETSP1164-20130828/430_1 /TAXON_ID=1104430 /ORGANISM="Chrysoreinhardia sp, Strain CCMP2950" /LENGTH=502 /DNA_ID=CAMNT_0028355899 /DNA_START=84 /DNA_END=1592 /DNA_ORIENTATION=-